MKKTLSILIALAMMLSLLCACSTPEKEIVGSWKNQKTVLGIVTETLYTFNEDGTGTISGIVSVAFTYSFADEKLTIKTEALGIENTETYSYQFDKDSLILTGESETINLEKIK